MKLKLTHSDFIARKITNDIIKSPQVEVRKTKDEIKKQVLKIINDDIQKEINLDNAVNKILDENEDDIEFYHADTKELFWMTKKKLANDFDVHLKAEDRYTQIAFTILDTLYEEDFIHFTVADNFIKNIILGSIEQFMAGFDDADTVAYERIKNFHRRIVPGTDEYNDIYMRLYEEELIKRGLI
ncbi:MAG: competence protein [Campylobacteraceae bacterium 4484_166]|nr:MAG: competence protein [Campylobacteraceae bacterium 4484_166]